MDRLQGANSALCPEQGDGLRAGATEVLLAWNSSNLSRILQAQYTKLVLAARCGIMLKLLTFHGEASSVDE